MGEYMKKSFNAIVISVICIVAGALCFVMAACNVDYADVYNDDAKIISYDGNYSAVGRVRNVHAGKAEVSCMSFSGVDTLYSSYSPSEGPIHITFVYTGEEGKIKLVLTDKDNVYLLKECGMLDGGFVSGANGEINTDDIPDGKYKVKLVGYKAEFTLELYL